MTKLFFLAMTASLCFQFQTAQAWPILLKKPCYFQCLEIPDSRSAIYSWGQGRTKALTSPTLNILVWNIFKGQKDYFAQDFDRLAESTDLILLSEITDAAEVKSPLSQAPDSQWKMATSWYMKPNRTRTGVATGSSALSLATSFIRTSDVEPLALTPKVILVSKYFHQPTDQEILVLNIHGINYVGDQAYERQIRSAEPYLKVHKGPILFAGDFNIRKKTRRLEITQRILAKYGMQRVPWENPNNNPKEDQYDDAFSRGFKVERALFDYSVVDRGSDHPAIQLLLTPLKL